MQPLGKYIGKVEAHIFAQVAAESFMPFINTSPITNEVWHYTTADGLMKILESQTILSTQVACLNDLTEHRYLVDLIHQSLKPLALTHADPAVRQFLAIMDRVVGQIDLSGYGRLVACFSAGAADDLSQWRGYGDGECGFAIGFRLNVLREIVGDRTPPTLMAEVRYIDESDPLPSAILQLATTMFQQITSVGNLDVEACAAELLEHLAFQFGPHAAAVKPKAFSAEQEHRIIVSYDEQLDRPNLIFRQRKTLLSRHLPIRLAMPTTSLLPITRVMIGPGPAKKVSAISVADLLKQLGYDNVPVQTSNIPYRVP